MRVILSLVLGTLVALAAPGKGGRTAFRIPFWPESRAAEAPALAIRDVTAKLEGSPARIVSLRGPKDDLVLVLILDLSSDPSAAEAAKKALAASLAGLPPNAYVALMRAQDGLKVLLDPTPDRAALVTTLETLPVSGKAGLLDTIETAARIGDSTMSRSAARLAVFYVTDSSIYNYQDDYINPVINSSDAHDLSRVFPEGLVKDKISKLAASLSSLQPPLFIAHLAYQSDRLNEAYQSGLMTLAAESGGASVFCRSYAEIPDAIEKMMRTIASHYSLAVELPKKSLKTVQVQLECEERLSYRTRFSLKER